MKDEVPEFIIDLPDGTTAITHYITDEELENCVFILPDSDYDLDDKSNSD